MPYFTLYYCYLFDFLRHIHTFAVHRITDSLNAFRAALRYLVYHFVRLLLERLRVKKLHDSGRISSLFWPNRLS